MNTGGLEITPEILKLIASIDEFKGAWAATGRMSPDRLNSLRRVATIASIGSSTGGSSGSGGVPGPTGVLAPGTVAGDCPVTGAGAWGAGAGS